MNFQVYKNFTGPIVKVLQRDLIYVKKSIYLILISIYAVINFISGFKGVESFFKVIKFPIIYFIAGIIFTNIPFQFLFFICFLPAAYVIPIYYVFFVYMFIV